MNSRTTIHLTALFLLLALPGPLAAVESPGTLPGLVPRPVHMQAAGGRWTLTRKTRISAGDGTASEADQLARDLSTPLGWRLPVVKTPPRKGDIAMVISPTDPLIGAEGYRLSVTRDRVTITASTPAGLFYGGVTLRQLLPPEAFNNHPATKRPGAFWNVGCVEIRDQPRFPWRGLLLDPARHFLPPEYVKRFVDIMADHKLNSLQLHLTDDQGWRLEIKKYPRLTQIGSRRAESPKPGDRNQGDGKPYGPFFYTQQEIRDLVAHARSRHVTLVPEIEIPGHFRAALAAHPEYSCTGGPFEVRTRWGVEPDILCPGNDAAVAFAKDVLAEVCELFPGRFIHIGGDEAPRDRWKQCPKCQARIKAEGLKNEAELQTWLNHRLEEFLASKGRRLIGWDEILEGGLTPGAAVMSWRGTDGGLAAAKAGHDVVMSPTTHCYLDYAQEKGPGEPEAIGGFVPLEKVYSFDPIPSGLPPASHPHILGAQGNLWSEFLQTPQDVEYFAFPRAAALAEVLWSPATTNGFADFQLRLKTHARRLDQLGVNHRK
ncbi:MAG: beta-N-acetylhexosaminidase [Verrucomicrobiota bacterium]